MKIIIYKRYRCGFVMLTVLLILFIDAVLINSDDPSNTMESNVTVVTNSGVGIQVAEKDQRLCLLVMIPPKVDMRKYSQTLLFFYVILNALLA